MLSLIKRTLLFAFCFCIEIVSSQELIFENVSKKLDIPSLENYIVFQDSKGYIWFSTELGLYRTNGKTIKQILLKGNFHNETAYEIKEYKKGKISIITSKNRYLIHDGNEFVETPFSKKLSQLVNHNKSLLYQSFLNEDKDLIFNSSSHSYLIKGNQIVDLGTKNNASNFTIINKNSSFSLIKSKKINSKLTNLSIDYQTDKIKKTICIPFKIEALIDWRHRFVKVGSTVFFNVNNLLISIDIDGNYTVKKLPNNIMSISLDKENGLWIGLQNNGVCYFKDPFNLSDFQINLIELTITKTIEDAEGGIWCSTLEKGIFHAKNKKVVTFSNEAKLNKKATILKTLNNNVILTTTNDEIHILQNKNRLVNKINLVNGSDFSGINYINGVYYLSNISYFIATKTLANISSKNKIKFNNEDICIYQVEKNNNTIYALSTNKILQIKNASLFDFYKNDAIKIKCIHDYKDNELLLGCRDGLYKLNTITKRVKKFEGLISEVSKVYKDQSNLIWIGTKGDGVYQLKANKIVRFELNSEQRVFVQDLCQDRTGIIWAAANDGLYKMNSYSNRFQKITSTNGLLASNCNKITSLNDTIYVSSIDGIFQFPINTNFQSKRIPKLYLKSCKINNRPTNIDQSFELEYDENNIKMDFDVLSFQNPFENKLVYQLVGFENGFKTTTQNTLSYDNLPPNEYKLIVYGENSLGVKSLKPITINLKINKPFWKTNLFLISCFVLLLLLLFVIIKIIIKNEAKKTEIKKLIAESQLLALQSQMNPHFLFNAINSIQNFILKNEKEDAYDYLSKFSRLVRKTLDHSKQKTILLHEEIETINLYVTIEQLRFKNSFDYELSVDPQLDLEEYYLPTMILQPYVENAIWHGLMNLEERQARLLIGITKKDQALKIIIQDNGIGRQKANQLKLNKTHQSLATSINQKRVDLLNETKEYKGIEVKIKDLYDNDSIPIGTKVIIYIPINLF
jgi:ligand-binding sensor domain-containing protein